MELLKMTTRRAFLMGWGGTMAGLATHTFTTAAFGAPLGDPLAVVVANDSTVNDLSLYELKRLYMGDAMQAPGGKNLIPLNRGSTALERVGFDQTVLDMTPEQAARYWIDRRIRGQSGAPKSVDPSAVVQRIVSRLSGSVGYILQREVTDQVKVVRVDGKLPGQAGYPVFAAQSGAPSHSAVDGAHGWFRF
jgi:hypothetical protein